jgi:propionate CoA-transferase
LKFEYLNKSQDMQNKIMSADQAVQLIKSDDTITICSIAGAITPDKVLGALGERFVSTKEPGNLNLVTSVAVGDGYAIKGLEHLAQPGLIKKLVAGSFTVAKSTEDPPKIYQMMLDNQIEAYNFPIGVMMHLHREIAAKRPGLITDVGLGTFVDPRQEGGRMNSITPPGHVEVLQIHGKDYLFFPSFPIDVAIIRGTTADEKGNITMEQEYTASNMLPAAMAAHASGGIVIAQVKRIARVGSLNPQLVKVPGALVNAVVVDENQKLVTGIDEDPSSTGEITVPFDSIEPFPLNHMRKFMLRRVLNEIKSGNIVNLGYGITAFIPQICMEEEVFHDLTFTTEHGSFGGFPYTGLQFGGAKNVESLLGSSCQFDFIDGGGPDVVCLSFAELDKEGNVNVTKIKELPHITSGAGGFSNLVNNPKKIVFCGTITAGKLKVEVENGQVAINNEGRFKKVVDRVQQITFSGAEALKKGQEIIYVTERGVFHLEKDGIVLTEIAPGIDLQRDIKDVLNFELKVSDQLKLMDSSLFKEEPMGLKTKGWYS